ncbi:MAG TPA: hypothetical protein DDZ11_00260 [Lentisphaeria bacterium]|nr:hypothetical protein [Lentisphaeria bacterium]
MLRYGTKFFPSFRVAGKNVKKIMFRGQSVWAKEIARTLECHNSWPFNMGNELYGVNIQFTDASGTHIRNGSLWSFYNSSENVDSLVLSKTIFKDQEIDGTIEQAIGWKVIVAGGELYYANNPDDRKNSWKTTLMSDLRGWHYLCGQESSFIFGICKGRLYWSYINASTASGRVLQTVNGSNKWSAVYHVEPIVGGETAVGFCDGSAYVFNDNTHTWQSSGNLRFQQTFEGITISDQYYIRECFAAANGKLYTFKAQYAGNDLTSEWVEVEEPWQILKNGKVLVYNPDVIPDYIDKENLTDYVRGAYGRYYIVNGILYKDDEILDSSYEWMRLWQSEFGDIVAHGRAK